MDVSIGVLDSFYFKENREIIGFDGVNISDSTVVKQKSISLEADTAMLSDFETVRDYCVLFLENSVSFNYKNDLKLFAFLLPMEYVFEDFIFGFINKEIEGVNAIGQEKGICLDEEQSFGIKPDLILECANRKVIADTKYKMVYAETNDAKKGISQNDLYQMIGYAIRYNCQEIKLFYPNTIKEPTATELKTITIVDKLAEDKKIKITAHQLSIINSTLSTESLHNSKLSDCFNSLRLKLKSELEFILE